MLTTAIDSCCLHFPAFGQSLCHNCATVSPSSLAQILTSEMGGLAARVEHVEDRIGDMAFDTLSEQDTTFHS